MPDIGGLELLMIAIVALIVVGPKDLPKMFRKLGQFTGRMRGMAREFSQAMNDAADDAGVGDIARDFKSAQKYTNPRKMAKDAFGDVMEDIDPSKFEEGTATRAIAEKRAAAQAETKRRIAEAKAARAAEMSDEPEEPGSDTPIAPAAAPASEAPAAAPKAPEDPGPARVAAEDAPDSERERT